MNNNYRQLQTKMAARYPNKTIETYRTPVSTLPDYQEKYKYKAYEDQDEKVEKFENEPGKYDKLVKSLIISILSLIVFSSFAYSLSDDVFTYFHMDMFDDNGIPKFMIQFIHTALLFIIVYILLKLSK